MLVEGRVGSEVPLRSPHCVACNSSAGTRLLPNAVDTTVSRSLSTAINSASPRLSESRGSTIFQSPSDNLKVPGDEGWLAFGDVAVFGSGACGLRFHSLTLARRGGLGADDASTDFVRDGAWLGGS